MTLRGPLWVLWVSAFALLATANSAGYRYGASDQAFYGPAVMRDLDPALFPRDADIIEAQARLTLVDEAVAAVARLTTEDFPNLFLALYLVTLGLFAAGAAAIGRHLFRAEWTTVALLAALSIRHAVTSSGTNTLEGYFHPRQLAFALGILAVAAFLRGRSGLAAVPLAAAAALHPTTALWFGAWLAVAVFVTEPRWRRPLAVASAGVAAVGAWALTSGPLAGRLAIMDPEWLAAIGDKEYLFPFDWPIEAWIVNAAYVPIIWAIYRWRARRGLLLPRETALVAGCLALAAGFLLLLPLQAAHVALAIQLQPARIFWMLDFLAVTYVVWALAEGLAGTRRAPRAAAVALLALAALRGAYIMKVEFPDRPLFQLGLPGDWGRLAAWAQSTRTDSAWLAHPMHAAHYGSSLRVAAERDVFVEALKDSAIGMYDRRIALRTRDRLRAIGDFDSLSAPHARQLARDHELDYLVTEHQVPLPLVFQSGNLRVYRLR